MFRRLAVLLVTVLPAASLQAQSPLPLNTTVSGRLGSSGEAARYQFTASGPGVLTIAVHGTEDLQLAVMDEDGQPLPEGTADRDLGGDTGAEILAVALGAGGLYRIEVRSYGNTPGEFRLGATFLAHAGFARTPDPDGRPSQARSLRIGETHQDQLHPDEGDLWDWFTVSVSERSTLVVLTRMDDGVDGDLALDVFLDNDYTTATVKSDQDLQGNAGNESATVDLRAGQPMHIKVRSFGSRGGPIPYRISVTRVP